MCNKHVIHTLTSIVKNWMAEHRIVIKEIQKYACT